jgi:toxin ParE1/3/4
VRLVIRPAAREDILRQYRYYLIDQDAEAAAERFLDAARAAMEYVFRRPGVGRSGSFQSPALKGLRSWPVKGFAVIRIYYLASKDEVRVIRVLHGKRDVGRLLEDSDETR